MIYSISFFVFAILIVWYVWIKIRKHWTAEIIRAFDKVPGPKCLPIIGNFYVFQATPESVFLTNRSLAKEYPDRYKIWAFNMVSINLYNPEDVEVILADPLQLSKAKIYDLNLHPWLGTGLLTSTGKKWKNRRKILTPAFHFAILKEFCHVFESQSRKILDNLERECGKSQTNIVEFVRDYALQSLCETTMGLSVDSRGADFLNYKEALHKYGLFSLQRLFRIWLHSNFIFSLSSLGRKYYKCVEIMHSFTRKVIRERIDSSEGTVINEVISSSSGKKRFAMLDILIKDMKEGTRSVDYEGIREEVDTFMFEGHDTVTMGISYFLMILANHRNIQDKIVEEVTNILGSDNRNPTYQDLQAMTYLEMCIKESLRLYPPVPFIARDMDVELKLNDIVIPAGVTCQIHIIDLHRNPRVWPDPEKFDPDRFLPENCVNRHPFAYIPFSAGQRNCIGQKFAILEMKSFVSKLLVKYILEPIDKPDKCYQEIKADFVLRPKNGILLRVKKRENSQ